MDARALADQVRAAVSDALGDGGVTVEDVVIHPAGKRRLVRVTLARDVEALAAQDHTSMVAPLSLDEIADSTRAVSEVLDDGELMGQAPYTLEVSSSGVDHPLTTPAQFRRNVGRLIRLDRTDDTHVEARLVAAGPDWVLLEGSPDPIALDTVHQARVQVEFSRPEPTTDHGEDR